MSLPDYQTLMKPILEISVSEQKFSEAVEAMGNQFNLSKDDRIERTKSGINLLDSRVGWAITYLLKAGLVERPRRAHFKITEAGKKVLEKNPDKINNQFLSQFESFLNFKKKKTKSTKNTNQDDTTKLATVLNTTPEERIDTAFIEIEEALKDDLLDRIRKNSPKFFEELVVALLSAMGYGDRGTLTKAVGKSNDGGIDGIIHQDKLGLDVVYIQAKRYGQGNSVGSPELQAFVGALSGKSANKGVFLTTSHFSSGALENLKTIQQRIITIDGEQLVQLMIENGVGIKTKQSYKVCRIDEDFFPD